MHASRLSKSVVQIHVGFGKAFRAMLVQEYEYFMRRVRKDVRCPKFSKIQSHRACAGCRRRGVQTVNIRQRNIELVWKAEEKSIESLKRLVENKLRLGRRSGDYKT